MDNIFSVEMDSISLHNSPSEKICILLHGESVVVEKKWYELLKHYEVKIPSKFLERIVFVECPSKVLKLRCGMSMYFTRPIPIGDGFYIIPGFTGFSINRQGVVKSRTTNSILSVNYNAYGYPCVSVYDADKKKWRQVTIHILLAKTFVQNPNPRTKFYVNHIDGDKLNFRLENLEWVTSKENVNHAVTAGLRYDNVCCKLRDIITGNILFFPSKTAAAYWMGFKRSSLQTHTKFEGKIIPILLLDRYELKLDNDYSEWYYANEENVKRTIKINGPFQAKRMETGEVFEGSTFAVLSSKINISIDIIKGIFKSEKFNCTRGFLFKLASDPEWPSEVVERPKLIPRIIELKNMETGDIIVFSSFRKACDFLGIDKSTLQSRIDRNLMFDVWKITELK